MLRIIELRPFDRAKKGGGVRFSRTCTCRQCGLDIIMNFEQVYSWFTAPDSDIVEALPSTFTRYHAFKGIYRPVSPTSSRFSGSQTLGKFVSTEIKARLDGQVYRREDQHWPESRPHPATPTICIDAHQSEELAARVARSGSPWLPYFKTAVYQTMVRLLWLLIDHVCSSCCAAMAEWTRAQPNKVGGSRKGWSHAYRLVERTAWGAPLAQVAGLKGGVAVCTQRRRVCWLILTLIQSDDSSYLVYSSYGCF